MASWMFTSNSSMVSLGNTARNGGHFGPQAFRLLMNDYLDLHGCAPGGARRQVQFPDCVNFRAAEKPHASRDLTLHNACRRGDLHPALKQVARIRVQNRLGGLLPREYPQPTLQAHEVRAIPKQHVGMDETGFRAYLQ